MSWITFTDTFSSFDTQTNKISNAKLLTISVQLLILPGYTFWVHQGSFRLTKSTILYQMSVHFIVRLMWDCLVQIYLCSYWISFGCYRRQNDIHYLYFYLIYNTYIQFLPWDLAAICTLRPIPLLLALISESRKNWTNWVKTFVNVICLSIGAQCTEFLWISTWKRQQYLSLCNLSKSFTARVYTAHLRLFLGNFSAISSLVMTGLFGTHLDQVYDDESL